MRAIIIGIFLVGLLLQAEEQPDPSVQFKESLELLREDKVIEYFDTYCHSQDHEELKKIVKEAGEDAFIEEFLEKGVKRIFEFGDNIENKIPQYYFDDKQLIAFYHVDPPIDSMVGIEFYLEDGVWKFKKQSNISEYEYKEMIKDGKITGAIIRP